MHRAHIIRKHQLFAYKSNQRRVVVFYRKQKLVRFLRSACECAWGGWVICIARKGAAAFSLHIRSSIKPIDTSVQTANALVRAAYSTMRYTWNYGLDTLSKNNNNYYCCF